MAFRVNPRRALARPVKADKHGYESRRILSGSIQTQERNEVSAYLESLISWTRVGV